jgi:hypothetical protein
MKTSTKTKIVIGELLPPAPLNHSELCAVIGGIGFGIGITIKKGKVRIKWAGLIR